MAQQTHPCTVLAIRHAESVFNVVKREYPEEKDAYGEELYLPDCGITEHGQQQCRDATPELKRALGGKPFSLILSPLRRSLQTAERLLQHGNDVSPQVTLVSPLATEILRDSCDIGTRTSVLRKEFPHLSWDTIPEYWWPGGWSEEKTWERMKQEQGQLETDEMIAKHAEELRILIRQQKTIAPFVVVVCHSETIWWLTSKIGERNIEGTWTTNCQILDVTQFCLGLEHSSI